MRTIKFRGKNLHNGKWVCGYLSDVDSTPIGKVGIINSKPFSGCEESTMVIAESIGQFTGFLDFHRKEIYEGDIIQRYYNIGDGKIYKSEGVVVFEDGAFGVKQGDSILHLHSVKGWSIIGNIFDNPELLKGGEK